MTDGVPGGFWVEVSVRVAKMLQDDGDIDAIDDALDAADAHVG